MANYYKVEDNQSVTVWSTDEQGNKVKTNYTMDHPDYDELLKAARTAAAENQAMRLKTIASYEFAGTKLQGKGWTIEFSKDYDRTMLRFSRKPEARIRDSLKAAKWYWSPSRSAWVKPLNRKSYNEAQQMHNLLWMIAEGKIPA